MLGEILRKRNAFDTEHEIAAATNLLFQTASRSQGGLDRKRDAAGGLAGIPQTPSRTDPEGHNICSAIIKTGTTIITIASTDNSKNM